MKQYVRIKLQNKVRTFILQIISENEKFLIGIEVDKYGDEVSGKGYDERKHIIEKTEIKRATPMQMNLFYGELEEKKTAIKTIWWHCMR